MLCSQFNLKRQDQDFTEIKLLPCRSWGCELCAPARKRQLMAIAASGKPSICLTLTSNNNNEGTPESRYKDLHTAWRDLVKRIIRQLKKPASKRWILKTEEGYEYQELRSYVITRKTKEGNVRRLHYMAFAEETEKGEPHLHILLRTVYIPQRWLSQQMKELINSPILWIEKIKSTKAAIGYVCKYVTDAPAQFGKSRRYWKSRFYQVNTPEHYEKREYRKEGFRAERQSFRELVTSIIIKGQIPQVITRTEVRIRSIRQHREAIDGAEDTQYEDSLVASGAWLASWRSFLRI